MRKLIKNEIDIKTLSILGGGGFKQGDTVTIEFNFVEYITPSYKQPATLTGQTLIFYILKPNGKYIIQDKDVIKTDNKVTIKLDTRATALDGNLILEIVFTDLEGNCTSSTVCYNIGQTVLGSAIEDTNTGNLVEEVNRQVVEGNVIANRLEPLIPVAEQNVTALNTAINTGDLNRINNDLNNIFPDSYLPGSTGYWVAGSTDTVVAIEDRISVTFNKIETWGANVINRSLPALNKTLPVAQLMKLEMDINIAYPTPAAVENKTASIFIGKTNSTDLLGSTVLNVADRLWTKVSMSFYPPAHTKDSCCVVILLPPGTPTGTVVQIRKVSITKSTPPANCINTLSASQVSLATGWAMGTVGLRYVINNGVVTLFGSIKKTAEVDGWGKTVLTFPDPIRPMYSHFELVATTDAGDATICPSKLAVVSIDKWGNLYINARNMGLNKDIYLDGVSFINMLS